MVSRSIARARRAALVASLALLLAGCGSEPSSTESIGSSDLPIFGGQNATTCQWPTTVLLSGCTGTLVHPLIVTSAAHCGTGHRTATFGETRNSPGARTVNIEYCRTYSGPRVAGYLTDWAFCKLAQPVNDVPIAPILMGCETEILKPGQKVVVAGFGDNNDNGGGFGTKRWVETTVNRVDTGRGIQVGGMGKAPCFGDSGGPAFVQLPDGSWRAFGIDSSGTGSSCGAGDPMALIHPAVPWIEMSSGIDVTPCTDADGQWNPGPSCKDFSLDPLATGRTWANGCAEPMLSGLATTCAGGSDAGLVFDSGNSSGRDSGSDAVTRPDARDSGGSGLDAAGGRAGGAGAGGAGTGGNGGRAGGASGAAGDGGRGGGDAGGGLGGMTGVGTVGVGTTTGAGGSTGTIGGAAAGGASTGGRTGGVGGDNSIQHAVDASAGCTCRMPGERGASGSGQRTLLTLALGALVAARRRRHRASV